MAVSKKLRFEVFKRDSFTCQYCGRSAPDAVLECDHIEPVSKGGQDDILNLITSCFDCNRGKSNRELDDDAVLAKRKAQLDELQERREQIEMMVEWQKSLANLETMAAEGMEEVWNQLMPRFRLNAERRAELKAWCHRLDIALLGKAMRFAVNQYAYRYGNPNKIAARIAWNQTLKFAEELNAGHPLEHLTSVEQQNSGAGPGTHQAEPPNDIVAEQVVLGTMLLGGTAARYCIEEVWTCDLYHEAHRCIFSAIRAVNKAGLPVDVVTVGGELLERQHLHIAGGGQYLTKLVGEATDTRGVEKYVSVLKQHTDEREFGLVGGGV